MKNRIVSALASLLTLLVSVVHAQTGPSAARAVRDIQVLAHDSLGGRAAGSLFADKAADYIESQFRAAGLLPLGTPPSYRQRFRFLSGLTLGPDNAFSAVRNGRAESYSPEVDFRAMTMSASGQYSGEVVFAGYGIVAPGEKHDDYEGLDVAGKAVIILTSYPDTDNPHSALAEHATAYVKVQKAKEKGARAVIFVRAGDEMPEDSLMPLRVNRDQPRSTLVVVHVTRSVADKWLMGSSSSIDSLAAWIKRDKKSYGRAIASLRVTVTTDIQEVYATSDNIAGYLPGTDTSVKEEYLIIGAHYDHLGMGGPGSGSLDPSANAIHNGADDNASGSGALLELARTFAARRATLRRGMLFLAFTGEELGLVGSAHYTKNPLLPLGSALAMLNLDMVGRMKEKTIVVFGMGTAGGFDSLVQKANTEGLVLKLNPDGFGPSDHSSFYAQKIPVMFFFTDLHPQYHRPTDDADLILADSLQAVLNFVDRIASELVRSPMRPVYAVAPQSRPQGQARGFRVWVGTIPDYAEQTDGMKISGISPGSPAEKAGLAAGDVMIRFGKVEIKNVYDYTYALGQYKPGDAVEVVVRRSAEQKSFTVNLVSRNR